MFEDPSWNGDLANLEPQISPNTPRPPRSNPKTGDVPMPDGKPAFVKNQEQMQREAEARERKANGLGHGHGKKRKGASGYTQPAKKRIASSTTQRQVLVPMEVIEHLNSQSKTIYEMVRRQGTLPASPDSKPPTEDKGRSRERHSRDNQPQPGSSELSNRDPPRRSTDTSQQNSRGPPRRRSRDTDRPSYEDHHDSHCISSNPSLRKDIFKSAEEPTSGPCPLQYEVAARQMAIGSLGTQFQSGTGLQIQGRIPATITGYRTTIGVHVHIRVAIVEAIDT
jgi:hypothetical protein